jgi:hypothetical protein
MQAADELEQLHSIADEVREVLEARGHRVDIAMDADVAFDRGHCQSSLTRGLVESAVEQAAIRVGMPRISVRGGGVELSYVEGFEDRRYRLRKATRLFDGTLDVPANSESGLTPAGVGPDELPLIEIRQWVFAVMIGDDRTVEEVVAARVTGAIEGNPGRLVFGEEVALGRAYGPMPAGFKPTDEGLPGFEEDETEFGSAVS